MRYIIQAACGCNTGKIRNNNEDNFFFEGWCLERDHNGLRNPATFPIIGIAVVIIILLLLRSCGGSGAAETPETTTAPMETTVPAETTVPEEETTKPSAEWSRWVGELPDDVTEADYLIEERVIYRSRELLTTSSTEKKRKAGH